MEKRRPDDDIARLEAELRRERDLADHHRAVSRLTSEYTFRLEVSPNGAVSMTSVTQNVQAATGRSLEQIRSPADWARIVHPEDSARLFTLLEQLTTEGGRSDFEGRFRTEAGRFRWVHVTVEAVRDPASGRVASILGAVADVSARKEAELALRESEERWQFALEGAGEGVWDRDITTGTVFFSRRWKELLGYADDEIPSALSEWESRIHPDDRGRVLGVIEDHFAGKTPSFECEQRLRCRDGSYRWMLGRGKVVLRDAQGRPLRVIGTTMDITDRKRAEAERDALKTQLLHAQKMESIGRLAGGLAHDFNNMLGVILGQVQLAMRAAGPVHPLRTNLLEIQAAATRSAELTQQLLAFARKQTIAPAVVDLKQVIPDLLKMVRRLISEDVALVWKPAEQGCHVLVDPSQLGQILTNLCVNARDAIADTGVITIETARVTLGAERADVPPGEYVRLRVSDDGHGMDGQVLEHLFEPFFTTKEPGKGTGLGLATVYGIVKQNGGGIDVSSVPGRGTTVDVCLPCQPDLPGRVPSETRPPIEGGHETLLLVEDEPALLDVGRRMLEELGYTVIAADAPDEAIRLAREHPGAIDMLVTDTVMPQMNGPDLAQTIGAIRPGIKHMLVSGYNADVLGTIRVPAQGVVLLKKPFSLATLAGKVREALNGRCATPVR